VASAAGTLLLDALLRRTRDRRAVLRAGSASAAGRELRPNNFIEEVFFHLGGEHFVRQVDGADLLTLQIENIQGSHVKPLSAAT